MRPRKSFLPLTCLAAALLAGLVLVALIGLVISLPGLAASNFGPPSPDLSALQRLRLSAQLLLDRDSLTTPANPLAGKIPFKIELGESPYSVAARLETAGLVLNAKALLAYLQYSGMDRTIQAGNYELNPALTALDLALELQDATPGEIDFTVLAGWRLEEIAASIPTTGFEFTPEQFLQAAHRHPQGFGFLKDLPEDASLEGFLFPGVYRLPREMTPDEVVSTLLTEFADRLTPEIHRGFARQGLSIDQGVTLASIVQRESMLPEEMPLIASVFLNRLAAGMQLEADSTAQYGIGFNPDQQTWWTNPLSAADLLVASPYNTYRSPGLPPGPISNPGLNALRAVAFPGKTPYFYFRAACDGSGKHTFAKTFEEHVANACP